MAGFNVARFRANGPVYGLARPTLFSVNMSWPSAVIDTSTVSNSTFLIKAAQLPASIVDAIEVGYFGRKIKLQGDRTYQDWTVTVMNDEDFSIRNAFEQWHNSINGIIGNRLDSRIASVVPSNAAGGNSYKVDAVITQFSKEGPGEIDGPGAIKSYKFNGMFPISVDAIQVDWDATNQYEQFDVTFAYDWWEPMANGVDTPLFDLELDSPI
jgi:hypothetical protein